MNIDLVRKQIPVTARHAYFDNAGTGPPPIPVLNAINEYMADWKEYGENWEEWLPMVIESRRLFGKMVGATLEEIGCVPNVSTALASFATSVKYKPGGNIVISDLNFPTNIYLWHLQKRHGKASEIRLLHRNSQGIIPLDEWEKAIDDQTSLVSVDYVSWANGCREKIREIAAYAHDHDSFIIGDSFHALGVMPVNAREDGLDALVCGMYKWMQGPHGVAYVYINKDRIGELDPQYVGWHGVRDSVASRIANNQDLFGIPFDLNDAEPAADSSMFEGGTWSVIAVAGARAALEWALKDEMHERYRRVLRITEHLIEGLKKKGRRLLSPQQSERRSGIVVFEDPDPSAAYNRLKSLNITVASRVKSLRASAHYYNTEEEIDKLLNAL